MDRSCGHAWRAVGSGEDTGHFHTAGVGHCLRGRLVHLADETRFSHAHASGGIEIARWVATTPIDWLWWGALVFPRLDYVVCWWQCLWPFCKRLCAVRLAASRAQGRAEGERNDPADLEATPYNLRSAQWGQVYVHWGVGATAQHHRVPAFLYVGSTDQRLAS
jgi:hypothetical protein